MTGSFDGELGRVEFRSEFVSEQVLEMVYQFHGMTVTMTVDYDAGVLESDGFATDNGDKTQMLDADRELMTAFETALGSADTPEALVRLRTMAGMLGEFPTGRDLEFQLMLDGNRGDYSICWALNSYQSGTHDGWGESNWADNTTLDDIWVGANGPCQAGQSDSDTQTTYFWTGSAWTCPSESSIAHSTSIEYAYGDCFGRCGGGCGSGHVYSWSCLDHDVCNRYGHSWSASVPPGHCADEFANAVAEAASEPNCY